MSAGGIGAAGPGWRPLDPVERRVLGVLIEKAKTTPAGYPMSVNAIVAGCNQRNNREPVMALDDFTVEKTLDTLRTAGAVSELDWVGRVAKYKHRAYEWLGVGKAELAVLAELLLRGAQTVGALRARAARMEPIPDLAALLPIVEGLRERGLMLALTPPGRGQVVSHNLYPPAELAELAEVRDAGAGRAPAADDDDVPSAASVLRAPEREVAAGDRVAALEREVGALRAEVDRLGARVAALAARLGETGD